MINIAINGFGRIGRALASLALEDEDINIVAINDLANWEILAHLWQRDSVYGRLDSNISFKDNKIITKNNEIKLYNTSNISSLDLSGVDILVESSGKFLDSSSLAPHLKSGAKKIILSAPPKNIETIESIKMYIYGINHKEYKNEQILSNASCTANALVPICYMLDNEFKIKNGSISIIHSYTSEQMLLDNAYINDKRLARAAGLNIIPAHTGSINALEKIMPSLKEKLHGVSVRVPVASVLLLDMSFLLESSVNLASLNEVLLHYANGELKDIFSLDSNFGVSSDFIKSDKSVIVAKDLSVCISQNLVRIMAWCDNEWGYANRIKDMIKFIQ